MKYSVTIYVVVHYNNYDKMRLTINHIKSNYVYHFS